VWIGLTWLRVVSEPSATVEVGNFLTSSVTIPCSKGQCTVKIVNSSRCHLLICLIHIYKTAVRSVQRSLLLTLQFKWVCLSWAHHVAVTVVPELAPPVSHSREVPFYANIKVIVPIIVSLGFLLGLFGVAVFIHRKSKYECLLCICWYAQFCTS
jgi:hypothetical protein